MCSCRIQLPKNIYFSPDENRFVSIVVNALQFDIPLKCSLMFDQHFFENIAILFAMTEKGVGYKGISCFIVEKGIKG